MCTYVETSALLSVQLCLMHEQLAKWQLSIIPSRAHGRHWYVWPSAKAVASYFPLCCLLADAVAGKLQAESTT